VRTVLLLLAVSFGLAVGQRTLEVCSGCELTSLHSAVQEANPGDRIVVRGGVFREGQLVLDKPLSLIGENWPVLDGGGEVEILTITADDVWVSGFVFQNSGVSHTEDLAALKVDNVSGCVVEGNRFLNNFFAIYLARAERCQIRNNEVTGAATSEVFSGNAIHLWNSSFVSIEGNHLSGHRDGIYLEFVQDSSVTDNISEDHLRYGLHFMFSSGNEFHRNTFQRSGAGVAVMYSKETVMMNNRFADNWGSAAYGLLLKEINDSTVADNTFFRNTVAIYSDGSNRIEVSGNEFLRNGHAVRLLATSMSMHFTHNTFTGNTFDVTTTTSRSYNDFVENYWDNYQGFDLDRDNVGDVPYRPVRLFSMTVENYPQTMILLRSPLEQFLDYAERLLPVFTPRAIEDDRPVVGKP
jgi:nitrous oxidase accessory protein